MKSFAVAVAVMIATTASVAAAEAIDSAFTHFDAKQCRHTPGTEEEDYGSWRCKGYGGIAVWLAAGDQRMYVSFGPHAADEPAASETFSAFNDTYEGTIEWRLERRADGRMHPFAAIMRWNVRIDETDNGHVRGRYLVVTRLGLHHGPGGVCRVGTVNALEDTHANETARAIADQHARSFRCGVDKSDVFENEAASDRKAP
jgi:hypothetical protein